MKCPHCTKEFHFESYGSSEYELDEEEQAKYGCKGYSVTHTFCPSCEDIIVLMVYGDYKKTEYGGEIVNIKRKELIFPKYSNRNISSEVPEVYRKEYNEAVGVLNISSNASAAISRRLLQKVLREELKIKSSSLAKEIDEFLKKEKVPSYLLDAVDAIRNIGNFAAHPLKDTNTGVIVDVENGEAEWLLDVLDSIFDFVFVQPKILDKRKNDLNEKLKGIGKPPMK